MKVSFSNQQYKSYQSNLKHSRPAFKSYLGCEPIRSGKNLVVNHFTYFFRECKSIEFLKEYMQNFLKTSNKKNFNIVDSACSVGSETYTIGMILNEFAKKMKIMGFDISKSAIETAKKGEYKIQKYQIEGDSFLTRGAAAKPDDVRYSSLFRNYFEENLDNPHLSAEIYRLKPAAFAGFDINFRQGNLLNLNPVLADNTADAFFLRNTLYHFTHRTVSKDGNTELIKDPQGIKKAQEIIQKIISDVHRKLGKNGLFILAPLDYSRCGRPYSDELHAMIANTGFRPLLTEAISVKTREIVTVWQKI